ncbi:MAG: MFS transporter [Rhizobiaceae bacterium]
MSLPPLSPEQSIKPARFEFRISLLFATLFVPVGIHAPYFPLWLELKGFGPEEIGVVLSAPLFLRVVTTPLITAFADRVGERANVYIACVAATLLLSAGYFLPTSYALVLALSVAIQVVWTPQAALVDALALSGVRRFGSHYPHMRIWGSIAFLVANLAGGIILSRTGAGIVPAIITVTLMVTLLAAISAPRLGPPRKASPLSAAEIQRAGPALFTTHFMLFVAAAGVINASHGYMFAFVSIYWASLGVGETIVGLLWSFAVLAEVGMFLAFRRIFGSVPAPTLLALAAAFAIVRWAAMPLIWPGGAGLPGFFAAQALHAFSTGLILIGVQKFIAETVGDENTGAAQGIAFFANGLSMAVVMLASGPIYDRFGGTGFFVMSGVAAIGLVLVALARLSAPQRTVGRQHS